jgi:hypothetical protein
MREHTVAQKVQILLVDDIDGGEASETVEFGLDGVTYEIDLSEENAQALRNLLAPYQAEARKVGGRRRSGSGGRSSRGRGESNGEPSAAEVREWARAHGHDVPDRGRVSAEVKEAFAAAH